MWENIHYSKENSLDSENDKYELLNVDFEMCEIYAKFNRNV